MQQLDGKQPVITEQVLGGSLAGQQISDTHGYMYGNTGTLAFSTDVEKI